MNVSSDTELRAAPREAVDDDEACLLGAAISLGSACASHEGRCASAPR